MAKVVAEVSLTPFDHSGSASVGHYVAAALAVLDHHPDLKYQLTAMATIIEGERAEVMAAIEEMVAAVFAAGAVRVSALMKVDERHDKESSIASKIASVRQHKPDVHTEPG
jgi:uncharacterized protein (TIGR00106 family)